MIYSRYDPITNECVSVFAAPVVEKKVEEPEEESDDDMGIGLFG